MDIIPNCQVAIFLENQNISLEGLNNFLFGLIREQNIQSKYYNGIFPSLYFLSKINNIAHSKVFISLLDQCQKFDSLPEKCLFFNAIYNTENENLIRKYINILDDTSNLDDINNFPFIIERVHKNQTEYNICPILNQVIVISAIINRNKFIRQKKKINTLDQYLTLKSFQQALNLPYKLCKILNINLKEVEICSKINLYGWTYYTLLDDILDEEDNANPKAAKSFQKLMLNEFEKLAQINKDFKSYYQKHLQIMDSANQNEIKFTHKNKSITKNDLKIINHYHYHNPLWEKSCGHYLTSIYIIHQKYNPEITTICESIFQKYLTIKQYEDDAHDCITDLSQGIITNPVLLLLEHYFNGHNEAPFNFKNANDLKLKYWKNIFPDILVILDQCLEEYYSLLSELNDSKLEKFFTEMINDLDLAIKKAKNKHHITSDFLKGYNNID